MIRKYSVAEQAFGSFNNGEIIENKPLGFPQDGGSVRAFSNLFYWANAIAKDESTIGLHPHQGFEIVSFVLEGEIRHFDTKQNEWLELKAGDVQVIRAGNGISHAEHMHEGSRMFQIWFDPGLATSMEREASYSDYRSDSFSKSKYEGHEITHLIGQHSDVEMYTDVQVQRINVSDNYAFANNSDSIRALYVLSGNMLLNGEKLDHDDFLIVEDQEDIKMEGHGELFEIISPANLNYQTYGEMMQARMRS